MANNSHNSSSSDAAKLTLSTLTRQLENLDEHVNETELQLVDLPAGKVLFDEGTVGDSMFIVLAGVLGVRIKQPDGSESVIDKLAAGATVGELALLSGKPRGATVFAINDARLLRLTRSKFEQLSKSDQYELVEMNTTVLARWQRMQLAKILPKLFGELTANELHQIQEELTWHHYSNGDRLFQQGDVAEGMIIVINGRLRVFVETDEGPEVIGEITAGEIVGEWGVITEEPRAATVVAVRETNVVELSRPLFEQLSREKPALMRNLTRLIIQREQKALHRSGPPDSVINNIVLLPASPTVQIDQFATQLAQALNSFGQTAAFNSQQFEEMYGQAGVSQLAPHDPDYTVVTSWISELETANRYLLFVADPEQSAWTERCINQADRVLIVAQPADDPTPRPAEERLNRLKTPIRTELVLWHPPETERPENTAVWLQPRRVLHHHHVRQTDAAHFQRLARRLTGNAIGLVLSGGAALGNAHLGVYKAFLELGIPIDYVGGTSMGAIMGGLMVTNYTFEEIERDMEWSAKLGILDYTLPLAALTRSKNVETILRTGFDTYKIEDLWTPFFCVSTNLTTAEPVVHRQGSLWWAIRASMSIPGVFLPMINDGDVLVDGGIMDNFPVTEMADVLDSERIVGVVISPFKEKKRSYDYDYHMSGWKVLWNRLNPFAKRYRLPTPANMLIWAMEINGRRVSRDQETAVDLLITPEIEGYGITEYGRWRELLEAGYQAALEPLRAWRQQHLSDSADG